MTRRLGEVSSLAATSKREKIENWQSGIRRLRLDFLRPMFLAAHVSGQYLLICNLVILSLLAAAAAAAAATEAKIGHRFFFAAEAFPHLSSCSLPFPHLFQLLLVTNGSDSYSLF